MKEKKDRPLAIRISQEERHMLEGLSHRMNRSLAGTVCQLIREAWETAGEKK